LFVEEDRFGNVRLLWSITLTADAGLATVDATTRRRARLTPSASQNQFKIRVVAMLPVCQTLEGPTAPHSFVVEVRWNGPQSGPQAGLVIMTVFDFFDSDDIPIVPRRPGSPAVFTEPIKRSVIDGKTIGFRVHQDDAALWRGRLRNRAHSLGYGVTVRIGSPDDAGMCVVRFRVYKRPEAWARGAGAGLGIRGRSPKLVSDMAISS
jgi:hypothetical protein